MWLEKNKRRKTIHGNTDGRKSALFQGQREPLLYFGVEKLIFYDTFMFLHAYTLKTYDDPFWVLWR